MVRQVSFPAAIPRMRMLLLIGVVMWHATNVTPLPGGRNVDECFSCNNLFKEIAKTRTKDFVCSPINAAMDLSMLAVGAKSENREQLHSVLGVTDEIEFPQYLSTIRPFIDSFANYDRVDLRLAQKMFLASGFEVKGEFVSGIITNFRSNIEAIDVGNPQGAQKTINDWIAGQANEILNDTHSLGEINDQTSIILVSVAYFRGAWSRRIPPFKVIPGAFWVQGTTLRYPLTMHNTGHYNYGELPEVDAKFIELPYKSRSAADAVSMFVILPNGRCGMEYITDNFDKVDSKLHSGSLTSVELYLPKFKIESTIDLQQPLSQLDVTEMFSRTADFRGISDGRHLKVSEMVQKVAIEVNEGGTEGGAVLRSALDGTGSTEPTIKFKVDRPFITVIKAGPRVTLFAAVVGSGEGFEYRKIRNEF